MFFEKSVGTGRVIELRALATKADRNKIWRRIAKVEVGTAIVELTFSESDFNRMVEGCVIDYEAVHKQTNIGPIKEVQSLNVLSQQDFLMREIERVNSTPVPGLSRVAQAND